MASTTCGWCDRFSNMTRVDGAVSARQDHRGIGGVWTWLMGTYRCDHCQRLVLAYGFVNTPVNWSDVHDYLDGLGAEAHWIPGRGVPKDFPDVPEHIADAASEAYRCGSINAHRAALALARAVIEATAKDKGFVKGTLNQKIDAMQSAGLIRAHIQEVAHEVRHLGNDMAHGDFVDPVSSEEVELGLTLMGEVLAEVYQSPARLTRARLAREAKKDSSNATGP